MFSPTSISNSWSETNELTEQSDSFPYIKHSGVSTASFRNTLRQLSLKSKTFASDNIDSSSHIASALDMVHMSVGNSNLQTRANINTKCRADAIKPQMTTITNLNRMEWCMKPTGKHGSTFRLCSFQPTPTPSPSFSARTLFKLLNGAFFYKKFLYKSCLKNSN